MDRVKDLSKVVVRGDMLFCKYIETKKTSLLLPDGREGKDGNGYFQVVAKGSKIDDVEVGDLILDYDGGVQMYPAGKDKYTILVRHLCPLIVKPDNISL